MHQALRYFDPSIYEACYLNSGQKPVAQLPGIHIGEEFRRLHKPVREVRSSHLALRGLERLRGSAVPTLVNVPVPIRSKRYTVSGNQLKRSRRMIPPALLRLASRGCELDQLSIGVEAISGSIAELPLT